jgi:hypothetical protein
MSPLSSHQFVDVLPVGNEDWLDKPLHSPSYAGWIFKYDH